MSTAPTEKLSPLDTPTIVVRVRSCTDSGRVAEQIAGELGGKVLSITQAGAQTEHDKGEELVPAGAAGLDQPLPSAPPIADSVRILLRVPENRLEGEDKLRSRIQQLVTESGTKVREVLVRPPTVSEEEMTPEIRARQEVDDQVWGKGNEVRSPHGLPPEFRTDD